MDSVQIRWNGIQYILTISSDFGQEAQLTKNEYLINSSKKA